MFQWVSGLCMTLRKLAFLVWAAKTLVVASELGYSNFVCTCLRTQLMTELNQKLTKSMYARYGAFTREKNKKLWVKEWGGRLHMFLCNGYIMWSSHSKGFNGCKCLSVQNTGCRATFLVLRTVHAIVRVSCAYTIMSVCIQMHCKPHTCGPTGKWQDIVEHKQRTALCHALPWGQNPICSVILGKQSFSSFCMSTLWDSDRKLHVT